MRGATPEAPHPKGIHVVTDFLIGTLYCGENEYDASVESIAQQEGVTAARCEVRFRAEEEAHELLYRTFMDRAASYRYFAKIDADMVLRDPQVLSLIHI